MPNPTLSPNPTLHQVPTDFMDDAAPGPAPVAAPMVPGEVPGRGPVIPGEVPSRGPAMVRPLVNTPHPATAPPVSSRPGVVVQLNPVPPPLPVSMLELAEGVVPADVSLLELAEGLRMPMHLADAAARREAADADEARYSGAEARGSGAERPRGSDAAVGARG